MVAGNVPLYAYVDIPLKIIHFKLESSFTTLTMSRLFLINFMLSSLKKTVKKTVIFFKNKNKDISK